jgi:hypothetical protein
MMGGMTLECPGCGVTVTERTLTVRRDPYLPTGLFLPDCGHVVTLDLLRQAWGVDLPEPNAMRVSFARPDA